MALSLAQQQHFGLTLLRGLHLPAHARDRARNN